MIETKARAVPRDRFPAVLERIARNVGAVGPGRRAHRCRAAWCCWSRLRAGATTKAEDGTPVVVHDEKSLRDTLRAETRGEGAVGASLVRRVAAFAENTATLRARFRHALQKRGPHVASSIWRSPRHTH